MYWRAFLVFRNFNTLYHYKEISCMLTYKYELSEDRIFIPGGGAVNNIFEGYIFIKGLDEDTASKIEAEKYFSREISSFLVSDDDVVSMMETVENLSKKQLKRGDVVKVTDGTYRWLYGIVTNPGTVQSEVGFNLCSQSIFAKMDNTKLIYVKSLFEVLKFPACEDDFNPEKYCEKHTLEESLDEPEKDETDYIFNNYKSDYIVTDEPCDEEDEEEYPVENFSDEDEETDEPVAEKYVAGYYDDEEYPENGYSFDDFSFSEIYELIGDFFHLFSNGEKDMIYLNFIAQKTQNELSEIFKVTQPALSNTSFKIKKQLTTVKYFKNILDDFLTFISDDEEICNRDKNILLIFLYSTSVTKVARILGLEPALCRARVFKAIERLKEKPGAFRIYEYFNYFMHHLNHIKKRISENSISEDKSRKDYPSGHVLQMFDF